MLEKLLNIYSVLTEGPLYYFMFKSGRAASSGSGPLKKGLQYDPTSTATYGVWNFWLLKWGGCLAEAARLYKLYKWSPKTMAVYLKRLLKAVGCLWGPTVLAPWSWLFHINLYQALYYLCLDPKCPDFMPRPITWTTATRCFLRKYMDTPDICHLHREWLFITRREGWELLIWVTKKKFNPSLSQQVEKFNPWRHLIIYMRAYSPRVGD